MEWAMKSLMKSVVSACVVASGLAVAAAPASAQVVLQLGQPTYTQGNAEHRADRIEERGDRKAARAAANGNYERAARIDRRSEQRADEVRRDGTYTTGSPVLQLRVQ